MAGEDPNKAGKAEQAQGTDKVPDEADFRHYQEEVADKVEGISGASAGGPAV
ncbi:MAG TPA: hypothetical protein VEZ70_05270 [Allosphingosinicella sp.]|jgi:hypothetical protein|nr:hypothetical protein [Allosphingosinicella sp.]